MFRTSLQNNIVEVSKVVLGTSLVVQWLRLHASNAASPGLTPGPEMATHFSVLAWKIPWTEEPGSLQSMGSQRVGHD